MTEPPQILLGLDPGERTGYALADASGALLAVRSLPVLDALDQIAADAAGGPHGRLAAVVLEDARSLPVYARHGGVRGAARDRLVRRVGQVDGYTGLLEERCARLGLPVVPIPPAMRSKWTAEELAQRTGWTKPTNEHARDAARLVFGRRLSGVLVLARAAAMRTAARPA